MTDTNNAKEVEAIMGELREVTRSMRLPELIHALAVDAEHRIDLLIAQKNLRGLLMHCDERARATRARLEDPDLSDRTKLEDGYLFLLDIQNTVAKAKEGVQL